MSFLSKPKVQPAPPPPAPDIAPVTTPTTSRQRRLGTQGVQSTFLGSAGATALAGPSATLTGLHG